MAPTPRIGLLLPQYASTVEESLAAAAAADQAGLDIWLAGQLLPRPGSDPAAAVLEPFSLMGAVAARTSRSRLGFMALAAPYYSRHHLARTLVTLDHLSGGRLEVGLGAGWAEAEFAALEVPFGTPSGRARILEGAIDAFEQLCRGEAPVPAGDGVVGAGPPSVQVPRPPVWVAGSGRRVLAIAGRRGDWSNFARGIPVEDFTAKRTELLAVAEAAGRTAAAGPGPVRCSLTAVFLSGTPAWVTEVLARRGAARGLGAEEYRRTLRGANAFVGGPEEVAEQMAPYVRAGAEAFVLWPLEGDRAEAASALAAVRDALASGAAPSSATSRPGGNQP